MAESRLVRVARVAESRVASAHSSVAQSRIATVAESSCE